MKAATQELTIQLQSKAVQKLNGPVLNRRTGKLSRSINQIVEDNPKGVTGIVWSNLGAPSYASFWEFGFQGTQTVKAHLRMMTTAFGKPVKEPKQIMVGTHTRAVNQSARSYLRSSLADMREEILDKLDRAISI